MKFLTLLAASALAQTTPKLPPSAIPSPPAVNASGAATTAFGQLNAAALSVAPAAAPAPIPGISAPRVLARPVEIFARTSLPAPVLAQAAKTRAEIIADHADPAIVERFSIPYTDLYVRKVLARLIAGSGLEGRMEPLYLFVNDSSWGDHGTGLNSGTLRVEPESVAAMSSEDEVAAVIAHELGHHLRAHSERLAAVLAKHPRRGGGDLFTPSRPSRQEIHARLANEHEADAISLILLANAGYDPTAAIDALRAIRHVVDHDRRFEFHRGRQDPFHPSIEERVAGMRLALDRERLAATRRRSEGLPEVYEELVGRHRPSDPETTARTLYEHYSWPKTFAR